VFSRQYLKTHLQRVSSRPKLSVDAKADPLKTEVHSAAANARSATRTTAIGPEGTDVKPLVAHALSKELQLYFDRLTLAAVVSIVCKCHSRDTDT
jgi:transcription initiation factor TFIID subunit 6